ncbi:MAG: hypothetical protein ACYDA8_15815 [Deferrisomatales bacterium]
MTGRQRGIGKIAGRYGREAPDRLPLPRRPPGPELPDAGAKLVVVDPRAHPVARGADVHLGLRPGTDLYLAPALLRLLVAQGGCDEAFLGAHAEGFEELREHLRTVDLAEAGAAKGLGDPISATPAYRAIPCRAGRPFSPARRRSGPPTGPR